MHPFGVEVLPENAIAEPDFSEFKTWCWFVVVVIMEASHVQPLGVGVIRFELVVVEDLDGWDDVTDGRVVALVVGGASRGLVNVEGCNNMDGTMDGVH